MNKVSVSILPILANEPVNFSELELYMFKISNADSVHIDVMDGKFVPQKTIWLEDMEKIKTDLIKNVHLMIEEPEKYVEKFIDAGADIVNFHIEAAKKPKEIIELIKKKGAKVGIALNIETPLDKVTEFVNDVDQVMIMPIHPGKGGQEFDKAALKKIKDLRKLNEEIDIEIDGGISDETGQLCVEAGASVLCSGSYLFNLEDPRIGVDILRNL